MKAAVSAMRLAITSALVSARCRSIRPSRPARARRSDHRGYRDVPENKEARELRVEVVLRRLEPRLRWMPHLASPNDWALLS